MKRSSAFSHVHASRLLKTPGSHRAPSMRLPGLGLPSRRLPAFRLSLRGVLEFFECVTALPPPEQPAELFDFAVAGQNRGTLGGAFSGVNP